MDVREIYNDIPDPNRKRFYVIGSESASEILAAPGLPKVGEPWLYPGCTCESIFGTQSPVDSIWKVEATFAWNGGWTS
jgi:hypothetical protein